MKYRHLNWDSEFFHRNIGRLDIDQKDDPPVIENFLEQTKEDGLYIFIPFYLNDRYLQSMTSVNAVKYDLKAIYRKSDLHAQPLGFPLKKEASLTPEIQSLVLQSGHCSRFRKDPVLNGHYAELYRRWIVKSFESPNAEVMTVSHDNKIAGFISASHANQIGSVELLAVHPEYQHRGIAQNLLKAADCFFIEHHCLSAEVVTQRENIHACKLYEKSGFKLQESFAVYHYWK